MGPADPEVVTTVIARDLPGLAGKLASTNDHADHRLSHPGYAALRHRLEAAHAVAEVTLVEARRRVRMH